jgi:hypothetical protein
MSEKPAKDTGAVTPVDRRGSKPGEATTPQAHGGRIGQKPFEATEAQRQLVRDYAKVFPPAGERYIARLMGISRNTLRDHFADDLELGRAQMLASVGSQLINGALNAASPLAKGDRDLQKFIMARLGGWSTKVDLTNRDPGQTDDELVDLSLLTEEEFELYGRLAAKAQGVDPDVLVATPIR